MKKPVFIGLILLFFSFFIITVGYSAMSTSLSITGDVAFRVVADVRITNMRMSHKTDGATETYSSFTPTSISIGATLNARLDYIIYELTVQNIGNAAVQLREVMESNFDFDNFTYTLVETFVGDVIEPNSSVVFYVVFSKVADESDSNLEASLTFNYVQHEEGLTYETDGLTLFLAGTDSPVSDEWVDASRNGNAMLKNTDYDPIEKAVYFTGEDSCILTNRTVLPTSGDFTVETMIRADQIISTDETVIAQKRMTAEREGGRFKPVNIFEGSMRYWITLTNNTTNDSANYVNSFSTNNYYHVALVKEGTTVRLYLNGALIEERTVSESGISDGTMQIGCYEAIGSQNYKGYLYFVRAYNKALTRDQLKTNYQLDTSIYHGSTGVNLREYALALYGTTSGDGIYYVSEDDRYIYRGEVVNNYIEFRGELWRIVSFENDNTAKLIRVEPFKNLPFDASGNRTPTSDPFCKDSLTQASGTTDYVGCSAYGITSNFANDVYSGAVNNNSSLAAYLNGSYYENNLPVTLNGFMVQHDFDVGPVDYVNGTFATTREQSKAVQWNGWVGLLSVRDYQYGSNKDYNIALPISKNWMANMVDLLGISWLMNSNMTLNTYDVSTIVRRLNGFSEVAGRRATRTEQDHADGLVTFEVFPVVYVTTANMNVTGSGTKTDPFELGMAR